LGTKLAPGFNSEIWKLAMAYKTLSAPRAEATTGPTLFTQLLTIPIFMTTQTRNLVILTATLDTTEIWITFARIAPTSQSFQTMLQDHSDWMILKRTVDFTEHPRIGSILEAHFRKAAIGHVFLITEKQKCMGHLRHSISVHHVPWQFVLRVKNWKSK